MEKLVLKYISTDGYTYSCETFIPFEYESKDKFVYDMLEKFKDYDFKEYKSDGFSETIHEEVDPGFGLPPMTKYEIMDIEKNVFTLDEWFELNKTQVML